MYICLQDLQEAAIKTLKRPVSGEGSKAPMYGMNAKMPDRGLVGEYLICYQDVLLSSWILFHYMVLGR